MDAIGWICSKTPWQNLASPGLHGGRHEQEPPLGKGGPEIRKTQTGRGTPSGRYDMEGQFPEVVDTGDI